jgi:hypothetical protein
MAEEDETAERRTFCYEEAAALLPEVRSLTEKAYLEVEAQRRAGVAQERLLEIVTRWARSLMERGLEVKGLWLVDFDNGAGYYCWRYPEPGLHYYHSYEEGFRGRVRIQ